MARSRTENRSRRFAFSERALRRLALLVLIALALSGVAAVSSVWSFWRHRQQAAQWRTEGIAAAERGDPHLAMRLLRQSLAIDAQDAEAWIALARCGAELGRHDARHLSTTVEALHRVLKAHPRRIEALHLLLEVHLTLGQDLEAAYLSQRLLAMSPDDVAGHRGRAVTLARIGQDLEALEHARTCVELDPDDLDARVLTLYLVHRVSPGMAVAEADQWYAQPDTLAAALCLAVAHQLDGDEAEARRWFEQATRYPPRSPAETTALVDQMDRMNLRTQATAVLASAVEQLQDGALRRRLLRRWYFLEMDQEVVRSVGESDPDSEALGIRLAALVRQGQADAARIACRELGRRGADVTAQAWWGVLAAEVGEASSLPHDVASRCREAVRIAPGNPVFQCRLGDAWSALGEFELSRDAHRAAVEAAPWWTRARIDLAQASLKLGHFRDAAQQARAVLTLQEGDRVAAALLARAVAGAVQSADDPMLPTALKLLEQVRSGAERDDAALAVEAALLARIGRPEQARALLRQTLAAARPVAGPILLDLVQVAREHQLDVDGLCLARYRQWHGITPQWACANAMSMLNYGQAPGVTILAAFDATAGEVAAGRDDVAWQLCRAILLERLNDSAARSAWKSLVESHPHELAVQRQAVHSRVVQSDHSLENTAIRQLRALTGDEGLERVMYFGTQSSTAAAA